MNCTVNDRFLDVSNLCRKCQYNGPTDSYDTDDKLVDACLFFGGIIAKPLAEKLLTLSEAPKNDHDDSEDKKKVEKEIEEVREEIVENGRKKNKKKKSLPNFQIPIDLEFS
uniref:Uncharacterized protein n=1 Tax=Strongyloides papillosus TaxID=174720 RepID=A0A0N5BD87_STREA